MTHTIKITNVKTAKNLSTAPTCFGSPWNHLQGAHRTWLRLQLWLHVVVQCAGSIWPSVWLYGTLCWAEHVTTTVVLAKYNELPEDGSMVNRNMSEPLTDF
jgi:hypothetical protein